MKRAAAELIGTFALVFAGTGAIVVNELSGGAIPTLESRSRSGSSFWS
jgi:glycerol uptake facilitator-like aquaporin